LSKIDKQKIIAFWNGLAPEKKRNYIVASIVSLVILFAVAGYQMRSSGHDQAGPDQVKGSGQQIVSLGADLLEKSEIREKEKDIAVKDQELKEKEERIKEVERELAEIRAGKGANPASAAKGTPPVPNSGQKTNMGPGDPAGAQTPNNYPMSPPPPPPSKIGAYGSGQYGTVKQEQETIIGDIEVVTNAQPSAPPESDLKPKKKEHKIYLPPSYMEATLLSGLAAPTSSDGKASPAPALLRIKDLAILPNSVKANLRGCFVIAEGTGNLADERAHLRLVSLSCLARDGRAVIDQKIKGFAVDSDGKIGLAGFVVTKMGAMISRSLLAGFFGGLGDAVKAASTTTTVTGSGVVQTVDSENMARQAVGGGLSQASKDLQKFYLELAKQTLPVIEVGASKPVTLVISEGVDLEIKMHCKRKNALGVETCSEEE
jgi:conjugal transfer pilus assembly protein TraB